jgi:hypothetical protein
MTARRKFESMTQLLFEQEKTIRILRAERDKARREICFRTSAPKLEAEKRGWDCLEEENNA